MNDVNEDSRLCDDYDFMIQMLYLANCNKEKLDFVDNILI